MPELKTEAEHREYLEQMAALSFFFAKKYLFTWLRAAFVGIRAAIFSSLRSLSRIF